MTYDNGVWFDFAGGLIGALLTGIIALIVMWRTNVNNRNMQERLQKSQHCNELTDLISEFSLNLSYIGLMMERKEAGKAYDDERLKRHVESINRIGFKLDIKLQTIVPNPLQEKVKYISDLINTADPVPNFSSIAEKEGLELRLLLMAFIRAYNNQ